MEQYVGKVIEVFIPEEDNDFFDAMVSNKIGFKVELDNETMEIIEEQNPLNVKIMKNDLVLITKQNISGHDFVDIELYDGGSYE